MTPLNYFVNYISYEFNTNNINYNKLYINICLWWWIFISLLYLKYGIQGRVHCLLFAISAFHFGFTVQIIVYNH